MAELVAAGQKRDVKVISLIGLAHSFSHFYQLVPPTLFPFLHAEFDVSYTNLAALMTLFYVASGLSQTPAGFLVDRVGARAVLFGGLALVAGSVGLMATVTWFWLFAPLAVLAGIGNSVFHPADYSILTASVSPQRIGRAYGAHTLGGNLGWAVPPLAMLSLALLVGWRWALVVASGAGFVALAILLANRHLLRDDRRPQPVEVPVSAARPALDTLLSAPILMCFGYFVMLAMALVAIQNFLPSLLTTTQAMLKETAGAVLTGFLLGSSLGIAFGAVLADRSQKHGRIVAVGLTSAAALFIMVGSFNLPVVALFAVITSAGILSGITTPSRDMLVRGATPKGAAGKVFGFVYSGLDAGSAIGPLVVGILLDHGKPQLVYWLIALVLLAAIFSAVNLGRSNRAAAAAVG